MLQEPCEQFAGNSSINTEIHEMLASFPEPTRSRLRKRMRHHRANSDKQGTIQADQSALHTLREFLVARRLNANGFSLEYNKKIGVQTPDWYDVQNKLVLEVYNCELSISPPVERVATRITEKVTKYSQMIKSQSLHFVVAVHANFCTGYDHEDCQQSIADGRHFERYPELSGVIFFAETNVQRIAQSDGSIALKQNYGYWFFSNPNATKKIDLEESLSGNSRS